MIHGVGVEGTVIRTYTYHSFDSILYVYERRSGSVSADMVITRYITFEMMLTIVVQREFVGIPRTNIIRERTRVRIRYQSSTGARRGYEYIREQLPVICAEWNTLAMFHF